MAGAGSNTWAKVTVSGLSDAGHVVTLDLTGNTGTVVLYGHYLGRSAGTGVAFCNMGHAGGRIYTWGGQRQNLGIGILQPNGNDGDGHNYAWQMIQDMGFDAFAVISGTNDARTDGGIGYFTYGLTKTAQRLKALGDGIGVILMPSPDTYDAGDVLMSRRSLAEEMYRVTNEVLRATDTDQGVDFFNSFGAVPAYDVANALGYYADETGGGDGNHMTATGGEAFGLAFINSNIL